MHSHQFGECRSRTRLSDDRLRGYKIVQFIPHGEESTSSSEMVFRFFKVYPINSKVSTGRNPLSVTVAPAKTFPVFNLIDRTAKETGLTRPTVNKIFKALTDHKKQSIFSNPEGFASMFIGEIDNALADHIASRIQFKVAVDPTYWGHELEDFSHLRKNFHRRNWSIPHRLAFTTASRWIQKSKLVLSTTA